MIGRQKKEREAAIEVKRILDAGLPSDYRTHIGKPLLYRIEVDGSGEVTPKHADNPKLQRNYAFQTDILIERTSPSLPMVVIELKYGAFSTHDILTYSAKAVEHKRIYRYLRYGFIVIGLDRLGRRLLTHNQGFDFAIALPAVDSYQADLVALTQRQIASAECVRSLMATTFVRFAHYEQSIAVN